MYTKTYGQIKNDTSAVASSANARIHTQRRYNPVEGSLLWSLPARDSQSWQGNICCSLSFPSFLISRQQFLTRCCKSLSRRETALVFLILLERSLQPARRARLPAAEFQSHRINRRRGWKSAAIYRPK